MSSFTSFKLLVPCALALYFASGCLPDLTSLSAEYVATAGSGDSAGAGSSDGGMSNGSGGTPVVPKDACANNKHDSNESDVDCGGTSECLRCAANSRCTANRDCDTKFCDKTQHCAEPTCTDGAQNQDETAVDCGGSCRSCDIGVLCEANTDCMDLYCKDGVCADHCLSGTREKELAETDVDCGGSCNPCADGKGCVAAADCQSAVCSNQKCQIPTCTDQVKNQDESDKDCGGKCAATKPCPVMGTCNGPADCESWICSAAGKCLADPVVVKATAVIDDFEDGDLNLPVPALESRAGSWYFFGDGTSTASYGPVAISRGASHGGLHTKGKDFTMWGSGVGVDMLGTAKVPYDASKYAGVTFWARAETAVPVTVVFPDVDTESSGGLCTVCDHHYNKVVSVTTEWQRFSVKFADLILEPDTEPPPTMFKPGGLVSVQFRMLIGTTYDLYIDDVGFVEP